MAKNENGGFWTLQKKIVGICVLITSLAGATLVLSAGGNNMKEAYRDSVARISRGVADTLDSIRCESRLPIDSMILSQLKAIRMDQRKTSFMSEKTTEPAKWSRAEAAWRADSIWNVKHPAE
jgi:hypothetical protein